jgi:hypothetical protein
MRSDGFDDERRAIAVLHIGGVDRGSDHQARGVGHDVPLAALDLLGGVVAARPAALGGLDRLAVDHPGRGARFATGRFARFEQEFEIDLLEQTIVPPIIKITLHCGEWRKVLRQHAPLTAGPRDIQNAVEDGAQIGLARPPQRLSRRHVGFDHGPLGIGQVTCITLPRTLILRSSDFSPHVVLR